jgi:hypothetical protein
LLGIAKYTKLYKKEGESLSKVHGHRDNIFLRRIVEQPSHLLVSVDEIPDALISCSTAKSLADLCASISRK